MQENEQLQQKSIQLTEDGTQPKIDLTVAIDLIKSKYGHIRSYVEMAEKINYEFGTSITEEDIFYHYEPTAGELEMSLRIQMGMLNFY